MANHLDIILHLCFPQVLLYAVLPATQSCYSNLEWYPVVYASIEACHAACLAEGLSDHETCWFACGGSGDEWRICWCPDVGVAVANYNFEHPAVYHEVWCD